MDMSKDELIKPIAETYWRIKREEVARGASPDCRYELAVPSALYVAMEKSGWLVNGCIAVVSDTGDTDQLKVRVNPAIRESKWRGNGKKAELQLRRIS